MKRSQIGFTLVELLVVLLLIGVMAAIVVALINPRGYSDKAENSVKVSNLEKVATAASAYRSSSPDSCYPSDQATLNGSGLIHQWPAGVTYVRVDCANFYVYATHSGSAYNYICLGDSSSSPNYVTTVNGTNCP